MTEHIYLVAVDGMRAKDDISTVKDHIRSSSSIVNWWNYIPYVFIVVSPLSADELSNELRAYTKDANLLVTEANLENSDGWLPEKAWSWIRRRERNESQNAGVSGGVAK